MKRTHFQGASPIGFSRRRASFLLATAIVAASPAMTAALDINWTGGVTGNWATGANWSSTLAPTADDNVTIDDNAGQATVVTFDPNGTNTSGVSTINGLSIDADDQLIYRTSGSVTYTTALTVTTTFVNSGQFILRPNNKSNNGVASTTYLGTGGVFNTGTISITAGSGGHGRNVSFTIATDNTNAGTIAISAPNPGDSANNAATIFFNGSGTFTNNGAITMSGSTGASHDGVASMRLISADSSAVTVTIGGTGSITLSDNAANSITRTGDTASSSTLILSSGQSLTGAGMIGTASVSTGINFTNNGFVAATGAANALILDPGNATSATGTVENNGRLVASGAGGLVLQGGTFNNAGVVEARLGSSVTLASTATFNNTGDIRGGGTISFNAGAGTLAIDIGSLTPGDSAGDAAGSASTVGALAIVGNLSLAGGSTLHFQLGDPGVAGVGYDTVNVTGDLTLSGTLAIDPGAGFAVGNTYRLFTYTGVLTDNGLLTPALGDDTFSLDASGGHVDLTVVPEPASLGLLGLAGVGLLRRRRRV